MATTIARLEAILTAQTRDFDRAMNRSETKMKSVGKTAAFVAGGAALGAIGYTLKSGISEWKQQQEVTAQTHAVLKSMGKGAGVTAQDVSKLANAILKKTGIDDEAIQSGENLLLTFRNIRNEAGKNNDIFTQATGIMTDFSVRFGKSIPQSAILVGKALNDPVKGMTALRRVGVQLTQHQQDQVKAFVKSGDIMKAQKIILGELTAETKGAAEAQGKTLPGMINIARESFKNWSAELINKMIPALTNMVNWVKAHWPEISRAISEAWANIKPTINALIDLVVSFVNMIRTHWGTIGPIVHQAAAVIKDVLAIITGAIRVFAAVLRGDWSEAWNQLKGIVVNVFKEIRDSVIFWKDVLVATVKGLGHAIGSGLSAAFDAAWGEVKEAVSGLFHKIVHWIKDFLGIASPSTVFHDIGVNMIKGLISGVGSMAGALKHYVLHTAEGALSHLNPFAGGHTQAPGSRQLGGTAGVTGGDVELGNRIIAAGVGSAHDHVVAQVAGAVGFAAKHGWHGRVNSAYRSYAEQAALYQRYLNGGPLAAKPGTSSHEKGEAVDVSDPGGFAAALRRAPGGEKIYNRLGSADPVHFSVSGYDKGGWLMPGATLAINNTGRPERVIPPGGGGDTYNLVFPGYLGNEKQLEGTIARIISKYGKRNAKFIGGDLRNNFWNGSLGTT